MGYHQSAPLEHCPETTVQGALFPAHNTTANCFPLPFKASRCIKASFYIPENRLIFPTTKGFRKKISMKLFYQYMAIFLNFSPTSNHLQPLQVENCGSNSRLVVIEDDNGKLRPERVDTSFLSNEDLICWTISFF